MSNETLDRINAAKQKCTELERKKMAIELEIESLVKRQADLEVELRTAGLPIDDGVEAVEARQVELQGEIDADINTVNMNIAAAEEALAGLEGGIV